MDLIAEILGYRNHLKVLLSSCYSYGFSNYDFINGIVFKNTLNIWLNFEYLLVLLIDRYIITIGNIFILYLKLYMGT